MQKTIHRKKRIDVQKITKKNISTLDGGYLDNWSLILCDKGTAKIDINEDTVSMSRNYIMLVPPNRAIALTAWSDDVELTAVLTPIASPIMFSNISEDVHLSNRLLEDLYPSQLYDLLEYGQGRMVKSHQMADDDADDLRKLIDVLKHRLKGHSKTFQTLHRSLIDAIGLIVIDSTTLSNTGPKSYTKQAATVRKFFSEMFTNYKEHHDVAFYAKQLGLSSKYISTVIKDETGLSALQWLNSIVIYKAKQMLRSTNLTVAEIAALLHFSSSSAFIRHFKNQTGTTPLAYKK